MSDPQTRPSTVELAETAARAVREMNHRTRGPDAFTGPAQLYRLVGELVTLVDGLPQLLNQLGRWLHTEHDADRLRSDNHADPGPTITHATAHMTAAGDHARDLAHKLARAQQHLAHLGSQPAARLDPTADLPACSTSPQVVPCSWQDGGPFTLASDTRRASEQAALILDNLDAIVEDLLAGAVVVLMERSLRIRRLPFGYSELTIDRAAGAELAVVSRRI